MNIEEIKKWQDDIKKKYPKGDCFISGEQVFSVVDSLLHEADRLTALLTRAEETKHTLAEDCERLTGRAAENHLKLIDRDAEIALLKTELSHHQKSTFHPDWSLLEATRISLREHMAQLKEVLVECERLTEENNDFKKLVFDPMSIIPKYSMLKKQLQAAEARAATHLADQDLLVAMERKRVAREILDGISESRFELPDFIIEEISTKYGV